MSESSAIASPLLTREEAAQYLKASPKTVAFWASQHRGPRYSLLGKRAVYLRSDLDAFVVASRVNG